MTGKLTRCYELYRCQIQHEDILLNQRVTWSELPQRLLLHEVESERQNQ
jgi:hypothetical protein